MIPVDFLYFSLPILCCLFFNISFRWSNKTRQIQFILLLGRFSSYFLCVYWTSSGVGKTIRRDTQWDAHKARRPTKLSVEMCDSFLGCPFRDNYWMPLLSSQNPSTWSNEVCGEVLQTVLCLFCFSRYGKQTRKGVFSVF